MVSRGCQGGGTHLRHGHDRRREGEEAGHGIQGIILPERHLHDVSTANPGDSPLPLTRKQRSRWAPPFNEQKWCSERAPPTARPLTPAGVWARTRARTERTKAFGDSGANPFGGKGRVPSYDRAGEINGTNKAPVSSEIDPVCRSNLQTRGARLPFDTRTR